MQKTTVQVSAGTLQRLRSFKKFGRQSYDEVLNELLDCAEEDSLSEAEIEEIKRSLEDIKAGRVYPIEQVAKELGIKLK